MANAPLMKLLPKILSPFKLISETPNTVTVDENGVQNTVSIDRLMLALYNAQGKYGIGRDGVMQNAPK